MVVNPTVARGGKLARASATRKAQYRELESGTRIVFCVGKGGKVGCSRFAAVVI